MEETSGSEGNSEKNASRRKEKRISKKNADVSCKSKRSVKRKLKTFTFGKWQKGLNKEKVKKRTFHLNRDTWQSNTSIVSESSVENVTCICTGYRKTKTIAAERNLVIEETSQQSTSDDLFNTFELVDAPGPSYNCSASVNPEGAAGGTEELTYQAGATKKGELYLTCQSTQQPIAINEISLTELTLALRNHLRLAVIPNPLLHRYSEIGLPYSATNKSPCDRRAYSLSLFTSVHTQVDYIHYLVPNLREITNCSFYWGKMDRYKAEKELDKKPEGTFLLRDSAQEEFLFSVSFRRYGRTLHARIEQLNHKFSFDSHDPNVFASSTVCRLVEHYKNPRCCMFFEPMLTIPVHRTFPFDLQHICRAVISDRVIYDEVNQLQLPKKIKSYLKEYHYKQRVRVRHLENDI